MKRPSLKGGHTLREGESPDPNNWFDSLCSLAIVLGALGAAVTIGIVIGSNTCR